MSAAKVRKLIEQVGPLPLKLILRQDRDPSLNQSEATFLDAAIRNCFAVLRNGWPDFLMRNADGKYIGVEVKHGDDLVGSAQAKMFGALEKAGVPCFVWHSKSPDRLTPWRKFVDDYAIRSQARTAKRRELKRQRRERNRAEWRQNTAREWDRSE